MSQPQLSQQSYFESSQPDTMLVPYRARPSSVSARTTKKQRTSYKQRGRVGRKFTPSTQLTRVNLGIGFPATLQIKHKYHENLVVQATSGTGVVNNYFTLNGLFDPYITGTGHQPMYFDQLAALYNHYTVVSTKFRVRFSPVSGNTVPTRVVLWQNDDAAGSPVIIHNLAEQTKAQNTILGLAGSDLVELNLTWYAKQNFGGTVLANVDLQGTAVANPLEQQYAVVSVWPGDGASTVNIVAAVDIEYTAIWREYKDDAGS